MTNEDVRHNWIISKLKTLPSNGRILDVGCGLQPYKKYCTHLEYTSQDFNQYNPSEEKGLHPDNWNQQQIKIDIVSDITAIPVQDKSFHAVLCSEVFEHIPNPIAAIKEFSRIIKPHGYLILTAPFNSLTHFAPYYYYSGFSKYFYEKHFSNYGFSIKEISYNGNYYSYLNQEISRLSSVIQQYNSIPLNFLEKLAIKILYKKLNKLSCTQNNTHELSCMGVHIMAQKNASE